MGGRNNLRFGMYRRAYTQHTLPFSRSRFRLAGPELQTDHQSVTICELWRWGAHALSTSYAHYGSRRAVSPPAGSQEKWVTSGGGRPKGGPRAACCPFLRDFYSRKSASRTIR